MQGAALRSAAEMLAADFKTISDIHDGIGAPNPYPLLAERRRQTPVMRGDIMKEFGVPSAADRGNAKRPVFTAFEYETVMKILRDPENWRSSLATERYDAEVGIVLLNGMDGEMHKKLRALMSPPFTASAIKTWHEPLVEPIIKTEFAEVLRPRGHADLLVEFALFFPVRVVYAVLGFPEDLEDVTTCAAWALQVLSGPAEVTEAAARHLIDYILGAIKTRRASGLQRNDLLGLMLSAELDGEPLTDAQIATFLRAVILPATETTTRTFANLLLHLLNDPVTFQRVRADRSLLPQALNESMRLEPVAGHLSRLAARDMALDGVAIPAGAAVTLSIMAAQRDERVFEDPDVFNIDRIAKPVLGWGFGVHMCLGQTLAKMEIETAMNAVLDFPNLRLDPAYPAPVMRSMLFRAPDHLHVLWDA